jgi:hypothetical protein
VVHKSQDVFELGAFVEVVCAEVLVEGAIFEHVVSGSENGSGNSTDGSWRKIANRSPREFDGGGQDRNIVGPFNRLQASLDSILPQGLSGLDPGGATRGKIAGKQRNQQEQEGA